MKTGREDLDVLVKVASIPSDEPTFLLRAQNYTAADTVRDWAAREIALGSPKAVIEQALRQADAMDRWPTKKPLNADHLSDHEAKQLAYAHSRRIWDSGKILREAHALALIEEIITGLANFHGARDPLAILVAKARELKAMRP